MCYRIDDGFPYNEFRDFQNFLPPHLFDFICQIQMSLYKKDRLIDIPEQVKLKSLSIQDMDP